MGTPRIKRLLFGRIDGDGRLHFDDPAAFAQVRAALRGQEVQVALERRQRLRSLRENAYYWGVVLPVLCEWSGYTAEEMHDALKEKFLGKCDKRTKLWKTKSTAELTTAEFEDYVSEIRQWASEEHGLFIALPNEEIY